jgi:hypothetical protein
MERERRMMVVITAGVLLTIGKTQAAIYKCAGPNGVVYSDKPCGENSTVIKSSPPEPQVEQALKRGSTDRQVYTSPREIYTENHYKDTVRYQKACNDGDHSACLEVRRILDTHDPDSLSKRIDGSAPAELIGRFKSTCANSEQAGFFALHTRKIQREFSSVPDTQRRQIFHEYCGMVRELLAKFPGGNPSAAAYFIQEGNERSGNMTLCILPGGGSNSKAKCELGFDVAYEDGQLKKNEI